MDTILVIDDEVGMRKVMRRMIEMAGYSVVEARDGKQGLRLFRETPIEVVITDIFMPEKEGLELIPEMKRERPAAKIIAVSGGSSRLGAFSPLPAAKGLGASCVLDKPFTQQQLLDAVRTALGQ
jgi:YesN/AraC family two-component response regulator